MSTSTLNDQCMSTFSESKSLDAPLSTCTRPCPTLLYSAMQDVLEQGTLSPERSFDTSPLASSSSSSSIEPSKSNKIPFRPPNGKLLIPYSFLGALAYAGPVEEPEEPNEEYGTSRGYGYIGFRSFSSSLPSVESLNRLLGWLGFSNSYVTYE